MDFSQEYILMCGKTKEIQDMWGARSGDFCFNIDKDIIDVCGVDEYDDLQIRGEIWLPRQDQLQEMINTDDALWRTGRLARMFYEFIQNWGVITYIPSMEQSWLAFIMSEKYGKDWDGNDWISK